MTTLTARETLVQTAPVTAGLADAPLVEIRFISSLSCDWARVFIPSQN
jgi:hypothetical protein